MDMKYWMGVLVLLTAVSLSFAITPDEIIRLTQLKTSDDVLSQLIQASPLEKPLTPAEVILLKENGVSEPVLESLIMSGTVGQNQGTLPPQEGESHWLNDAARFYYTTTTEGEKRLVVTNLDESGKRMGPPPPPRNESEHQMAYTPPAYEAPQQTYSAPEPPRYYEQPAYPSYGGPSNWYPPYDPYANYAPPYYNSYYSDGFIPDYPGSSFGFHMYPTFTYIRPVSYMLPQMTHYSNFYSRSYSGGHSYSGHSGHVQPHCR